MFQNMIKAPKAFEDALVRSAEAEGLIQVHWQKRDDTSKTEMVAQGGDFKTPGEMQDWIKEVLDRRKDECPEGWQPMICDSTSEYFVWAKPSA